MDKRGMDLDEETGIQKGLVRIDGRYKRINVDTWKIEKDI